MKTWANKFWVFVHFWTLWSVLIPACFSSLYISKCGM